MAARTITCENCGEKFISHRSNVKYCCNDCRYEAHILKNRQYKQEHKGEYKPDVIRSSLAETNQAARDAGMSYGKYVAQLWLKEQKW